MSTKSPKSSGNQGEYLNPINILGIPSAANRRSNQDRMGPGSAQTEPTNTSKMNFKILKSSHSRCGGMGSLLNLNKIPGPGRVSVQRSNSARECGVAGAVGGGVSILNGNITKHSSLANSRNNNITNIHYTETNTDRGEVSRGQRDLLAS